MHTKFAPTTLVGLTAMIAFSGCVSPFSSSGAGPAEMNMGGECLPPWQDQIGEAGGPINLTATSTKGGSIFLSWSPPDGPQPDEYIIYGSEWNGEEGTIDFAERGSVSGTSVNIDALAIGQLYAFQVAVGQPGDLQRSNVAAAQACEYVDSLDYSKAVA